MVVKLEAVSMARRRPFLPHHQNPYNRTYHSTYVPSKQPAINSEMVWFKSSEAKQRTAAAKAHAISEFKKRFPYADISRFKVQVEFDPKRKATG